MKKNFVLAAVFALFVMAVSVSAQKATDFSGKWTLDLAKSKLSDRDKTSIESQTMTVTQTAADIKIETATKRITPPASSAPASGPPGGGGGGGGGGGMGGGGGAQPMTYALGKDTTTDQPGPGGATIPVTMGSKWDGSKLVLTRSSTFNGPNGEVKNTSKETWELGVDGKSLTVNRESTGMNGTTTSTKVFTKA